jgi:hypothetical protein
MTVGPGLERVEQWLDESLTYMGRIVGGGNVAYTQATISSITVIVKNSSLVETMSLTAIDKTATVFDTLQTTSDDAEWTKDTTGYNFKYTIPETAFPAVDTYRALIEFTPVTGGTTKVVIENITHATTG